MKSSGERRRLRVFSFIVHSARGLIRDQATRRWTMLITLVAAILLLLAGTTFLQPYLSPAEHAGWFILFWLACAWLTLLALLLALFDLLLMRTGAGSRRRVLRDKLLPK